MDPKELNSFEGIDDIPKPDDGLGAPIFMSSELDFSYLSSYLFTSVIELKN